jgi:hypothetical protein
MLTLIVILLYLILLLLQLMRYPHLTIITSSLRFHQHFNHLYPLHHHLSLILPDNPPGIDNHQFTYLIITVPQLVLLKHHTLSLILLVTLTSHLHIPPIACLYLANKSLPPILKLQNLINGSRLCSLNSELLNLITLGSSLTYQRQLRL